MADATRCGARGRRPGACRGPILLAAPAIRRPGLSLAGAAGGFDAPADCPLRGCRPARRGAGRSAVTRRADHRKSVPQPGTIAGRGGGVSSSARAHAGAWASRAGVTCRGAVRGCVGTARAAEGPPGEGRRPRPPFD